ncbi:unnamed protein product [Owenia fusiformis]|uniref:Carbohydrate sulfotransferase n=1 Tax=Owenia fusiformis TaxID=6347 RepID=A0A8J1Y3V1_OWEFU|nr:unnamed protein product [Owenia fusiformis]
MLNITGMKKHFKACCIVLLGIYISKTLLSYIQSNTVRISPSPARSNTKHVDNASNGNRYLEKPRNLLITSLSRNLSTSLCNKSKVRSKSMFTGNMLIDETHKLLYCFVPKVGCTTWRKIFAVLSDEAIRNKTNGNPENIDEDPHYGLHFKTMKDYNSSQQEVIIKSYYKFMFVREPFERLISAYIDKFYVPEPDGFWKAWGKLIINKYRVNASVASKSCGHDVSFDEFLSHSFSKIEQSDISGGNTHWTSIQQICNPCGINYDYIGHMETMKRDTELILEQANVSHLITQHKAGISKIKQNLHFSEKALVESANCLNTTDAIQRIINTLTYKGFLPFNSTISEYIKNLKLNSTSIDVKRRNEYMIKQFSSKLDDILSKAWENKLKSNASAQDSFKENCLARLKKSNIIRKISSEKIKRFLEYYYLDFELFGYNSSIYS